MIDGDAWEAACASRDGIDREIYGGEAPNDSNALTEVWPTATGAGFTVERGGRTYGVVVALADSLGDLIRPDWGPMPPTA
jgi:hypothetical protein